MYEEYANRRAPIESGQRGRCAHCASLKISTASEYEWPCPILRDWICETHCCEIQMPGGTQTRESVAAEIGWTGPPGALRGICRNCPYSDPALLRAGSTPIPEEDVEGRSTPPDEWPGRAPSRLK